MTRRAGFLPLAFLLAGCASAPASEPVSPPPATESTEVASPESGADDTASPAESTPASTPTAGSADAAPITTAPDAWQLLDLDGDRVPGVSATRVYDELLAGRSPQRTVVVAVIDGGVDTAHVDLRDNLWRNPGETPGNGIDDDGNGYVDDVFGWNFIGGPEGNVGHEQLEVTRLHVGCQNGVEAPAPLTCDELASAYEEERSEVTQTLQVLDQIDQAYAFALPLLTASGAGDPPTLEGVRNVSSLRQDVLQAKNLYLQLADAGIMPADMPDAREAYEGLRDYGLSPDFSPRSVVGDDLADGTEQGYGNPDVMGPDAGHGTHVAGIIGAIRGNGVGIDGIANGVQLMTVRAVPDGDERDKDVANAIRYAVDNGAHIINMSFGKSFSPRKSLVDEAIRYADERGVLMVHAAGNDGEDIDEESNFPTPVFDGGERAELWIEVGAANFLVDSLAATFSNYGQTNVDIFSPGVDILSTKPFDEFEREDGTSMAAPVLSGVAAMLMAYFPDLDAADVRRLLMDSSVKYGDREVPRPGAAGGPPEMVPFGTLSVTGGVVNAYEAVRRAMERM